MKGCGGNILLYEWVWHSMKGTRHYMKECVISMKGRGTVEGVWYNMKEGGTS